ncbi:MAG: M23 family metallopeptidase [Chlorobiaceae bacterium]
MSLSKLFLTLCEHVRKVKTCLFFQLYAPAFAFPLFLVLFQSPQFLFAKEKQPLRTITTAQLKTTERILPGTEQMIEHLILQIDNQKESANNINQASFFSCIPNIKPVSGSITSDFGIRLHPIYNVPLFHSGIDFSVAEGSRVKSTGDGFVSFSGYEKGYGQKVTINHGYGYETIYGHLLKVLVQQGERVKRGDIIALSGNTGVSTGPHLHYEVHKNNMVVNPTTYFFDETDQDKFITKQKASQEEHSNNS